MGSRIKEDEKHEKIIRGLAKREENRKCINCGALGPQYVCTNFSIFICTNCSGVHREFTHRVKSISMAKFTAAEVAALQAGGNQRGREIFFKNWDSHRHTLPDSSYPDKLREFIKALYVDRRYTGDKPPQRGKQGDREDMSNSRKSDYRSDSYPESQSPSYEDRFENNRYGNRPLSRGSDGGRYEDRGLHYDDTRSPGRFGPGRGKYDKSDRDRRFEDRFANEGSRSPGRFEYDRSRLDRSPYSDGDRRFEDRFANEARDPRRTNDRPPTYPDYGSESSPPVRSVREILGDDIPVLRIEDNVHANGRVEDAKGLHSQAQPRKDLHTSSFGSSDNGASTVGSDLSLKRDNSGSLIDFGADLDITAAAVQSDPFGVTSLQPSAQPSSTGWAFFDVNPGSEQKVETALGLGAPLGSADPFRASKSGVEGLTTVATPVLDSWPSSLQWNSVNPVMANRPADENLLVPGQAGIQLEQKGPAPAPAAVPAAVPAPAQNQESKPQNSQRPQIPEDLFTPSFQNAGMQFGQQFPLGGPSFMPLGSALPGVYVQGGFQGYGQLPKSKNPFDLPEETAHVPTGAFPNMAVLQTALPNVPLGPFSNPGIRSTTPQWSQTAPVNQQPASFPSAGLPVGSGFFNQQPSTFMPPLLQPYSFTPAPSPDQFTGYQHGPQMFVPASGFGVPQSSTRPIGGNPFD